MASGAIDRRYEENAKAAKELVSRRYLSPRPVRGHALSLVEVAPQSNVVGVGLGRSDHGEPNVRIYVETKVDKSLLAEEDRLPESINGTPVEVVATGRFVAGPSGENPVIMPASSSHGWTAQILNYFTRAVRKVFGTRATEFATNDALIALARRHLRPAQPGCSVGFQHNTVLMAGTFGALVSRGNELFVLSNNHVLAHENALPIGGLTLQPGRLDGGKATNCTIAQLAHFVELDKNGPNRMDCAISQIGMTSSVKADFLPMVGKVRSAAPIAPSDGMNVHKVGRTTGYTRGVVYDRNADVVVTYPTLGELVFQEQVLIRPATHEPFSKPGDSGSVVVDQATNQATALLFAGSGTVTIATPLQRVMDELGVTLVI